MSQSDNNTSSDKNASTSSIKHKKSGILKKILISIGIIVVSVVLLVLVGLTVAVTYLKPEKLTPLVVNMANGYLDGGKLEADHIEISLWSTFPKFDLDIRGLKLQSNVLESLSPKARQFVPEYCDSILSVDRLNAGINIPKLLAGKISLYDIVIDHPAINIVLVTDNKWNFDIFPATDDKRVEEDSPIAIPDFEMGTFRIDGGLHVRYFSLPDTSSVSITFATATLQGENAPVYNLSIDGNASADIASIRINDLKFGTGGHINWHTSSPMQLSLSDFTVSIGDVNTKIDTSLDFSDGLRIDKLNLLLPDTPFNDFIALIPTGMRGDLNNVTTDLSFGCHFNLLQPYIPGSDSIPSFTMKCEIPEGSLKYDGMTLDRLELEADMTVDGNNPDLSTLNISKLTAIGLGMGFNLTADVKNPVSNPKITGKFKGGVDMSHLPAKLLEEIPGEIKGKIVADCDFNLRKSYLTRENFHKIKLKGNATITGLQIDMPEMSTRMYAREMEAHFGTNSSFVKGDTSVDSLLTASLKIDTISCLVEDFDIRSKGVKMGIGCRNTASSSDTTVINPLGGRIQAESLSLRALEDSARIFLRETSVSGVISRYKGNVRQPQASLIISSGTAIYADRINRAFLRGAKAYTTVHPSSSPAAQRRFARYDSLRRANPHLTSDSLIALSAQIAQKERASKRNRNTNVDSINPTTDSGIAIEADSPMRRILRNWQAKGSLKAESMRMFTPYFPLRNRIDGLDIDFSTDSINIHRTNIDVGHSDFTLSGNISNISRAITSTTGRQPLDIQLKLSSDTINVNEITEALFAGAAFSEHDTGSTFAMSQLNENSDESALQSALEASSNLDTTAILVIPPNIRATFDVTANNIIYSNLIFHDFKGSLKAYDGALNLSQLSAKSDIGSLGLNALYSAQSRKEATFAMGMNVNEFRIGEFLKLIPAIDSIMPLLNGINGVVNAEIAATTSLDSVMDIDIPSLKAAVKLSGDSLVVIDEKTFRTIGKWLLFKNKEHNMIDSMTVEMIIDNSQLRIFPFMFNLDRYKLGVVGSNDLAMNLNYHVAVLKSPLPFKFGVNITGNTDDMKIRLGKAKFNEKEMTRTISIADTTRINLVEEIRNVFSRGVRNARVKNLDFRHHRQDVTYEDVTSDTISAADSLYFIKEGVLPPPPEPEEASNKAKAKKRK